MRNGRSSTSGRSATVALAIAGTVLVLLYAALAAAQILVLNPLAAVPGMSLEQIWAEIDALNGTSSVVLTAIPLGLGVALAITLLVLLTWQRDTTLLAAAFAYLGMLALGAPAVFMASFPMGMDRRHVPHRRSAVRALDIPALWGQRARDSRGAGSRDHGRGPAAAAARQRVAAAVAA